MSRRLTVKLLLTGRHRCRLPLRHQRIHHITISSSTSSRARAGRAVLAAALGLALLTGVGGTFANWFEEQNVAANSSLTAGNPDMTVGTAAWKSQAGPISDIKAFRMVPGDTVTYTAPVTITALGDNLKAQLVSDLTAATGNLAPYVTSAMTVTRGGTALPATFTPADLAAGNVVDVTVTITLPSTVTGSDAEETSLDLSKLVLKLNQV